MADSLRWHAAAHDGSEALLRIGEDDDAYVAEWPGRLLQRIDKKTGLSILRWREDLPERARAKFLAGPVVAFERHVRGELSFHAGAMSLFGMAVCVLGTSGAGKSTCVYDACMRGPWTFVADDVAHVDMPGDRAEIQSTESVLALTPQSRLHFGMLIEGYGKELLDAPRGAPRAHVAALVELQFEDALSTPRIEVLRGLQAVAALMNSQVRLVLSSALVHARDMDALERLLARVQVLRLVRPRSLERMAEAEELLAAWLQQHGARAPQGTAES